MVQTSQIEFNYSAAMAPEATATVEDVERVVSILRTFGQLTAGQIAMRLGLAPTENSKRKVRAIARAARPGIVSFPNSEGYKLLSSCSLDEINACIATWDSVIRDATATKALFLQAYYSRESATRRQ
jgi:hypothetical protein